MKKKKSNHQSTPFSGLMNWLKTYQPNQPTKHRMPVFLIKLPQSRARHSQLQIVLVKCEVAAKNAHVNKTGGSRLDTNEASAVCTLSDNVHKVCAAVREKLVRTCTLDMLRGPDL